MQKKKKKHPGQASVHDFTHKLYSAKTIIIDGLMEKWLVMVMRMQQHGKIRLRSCCISGGIKENKIAEDTEMEYLGHQFWFILWLRLQAKVNNIKKKKQRNNDYLTLSQTLFFKQFVATNSQTITYH